MGSGGISPAESCLAMSGSICQVVPVLGLASGIQRLLELKGSSLAGVVVGSKRRLWMMNASNIALPSGQANALAWEANWGRTSRGAVWLMIVLVLVAKEVMIGAMLGGKESPPGSCGGWSSSKRSSRDQRDSAGMDAVGPPTQIIGLVVLPDGRTNRASRRVLPKSSWANKL